MNARLIALLIASLGLLWLVQQNHSLSASLTQSRQLTREQNSAITQLKAQLNAAAALADKNQQAQVHCACNWMPPARKRCGVNNR